jgi:hypothetical protein
MLIHDFYVMPIEIALGVIAVVLSVSVLASILLPQKKDA